MNYFIYATVLLAGSTIGFFMKWRKTKDELEKKIGILEADARECTKSLNGEVAERIKSREIDLITKY